MSAGSALDPWWTPVSDSLAPVSKQVALCLSPDELEISSEVETALRAAAQQLQDAGWTVTEVETPPMREAMHLQLLMWMSEYHYSSGVAIEQEDDPDAKFVYAQLREFCPDPTLESFMAALQRRVTLAREWQQFLHQYPILLCPVSAEPPFPDHLDVESPEAFQRVAEAQMTQIALPFMGMPGLTVTTGSNGSTPIGVQLVAARYREDVLFDAGSEIELRNPAVIATDPI